MICVLFILNLLVNSLLFTILSLITIMYVSMELKIKKNRDSSGVQKMGLED